MTFEFIYEDNGQPRNEAADKLGGIPADAPLTYYVRLTLRTAPTCGRPTRTTATTFTPGRPPGVAERRFTNPKIGPVALSDQAPTYPVADFDWIRFNPDEPIGGGGGGSFVDDFDGATLRRRRGTSSARTRR